MSTKRTFWLIFAVVVMLLSGIGYAIYQYNNMDNYLDIGGVYESGCHTESFFRLDGNTLTAFCDGNKNYSEKVENSAQYAKLTTISTDYEEDSKEVILLRIYLGHNRFKLISVWIMDWNKLPEGGCIIINNDYGSCSANTLVWEYYFHDYEIGEHLYGTEKASQIIGELIPEGTEAIVVDRSPKHIKILSLASGSESWSHYSWWSRSKP